MNQQPLLMSPLQLLNFQLRLQMSLPLSLKNLLLLLSFQLLLLSFQLPLQMNPLQLLNFQLRLQMNLQLLLMNQQPLLKSPLQSLKNPQLLLSFQPL